MPNGFITYQMLNILTDAKRLRYRAPFSYNMNQYCGGFCVGVAAGMGDAALNYPWTVMKIMSQRGQSINLRPSVTPPRMWYLGVGSYAASIIPTTTIQFMVNSHLKARLSPTSSSGHLAIAMGSGAVSAVFSNAVEHLILGKQQASVGGVCTYSKAIKGLSQRHGSWWPMVGYAPTAARDAVYAGAMLYGLDWVRDGLPLHLQAPYIPAADLITGITVSVLTQPLDVFARRLQLAPGNNTWRVVMQSVYQHPNWIRVLYKGLGYRTMSVVSGITVMSRIRHWFEDNAGSDPGRPIPSISTPERNISACSVQEGVSSSKYTPTFSESLQIGCVAGTAELFPWGHALWVLKTRSQLKYDFTFNREVLTRGLCYSWIAEMGLTAAQISVANIVLKKIPESNRHDSSSRFFAAGIGGAASTLFSTPADLGLTRQQEKKGISFHRVISEIYQERGVKGLFQGGAANIVRESIYAGGFFALAPWFYFQCSQHLSANDMLLLITSGLCAGLTSAVASHPADVVVVLQQRSHHPISARTIITDIVKKEGVAGIFKGSFWRMARVTSATCVVSVVNERMKEYYGQHHEPTRLVVLGKMLATRVLRLTSLLALSARLDVLSLRRCASGKSMTVRISGMLFSIHSARPFDFSWYFLMVNCRKCSASA